MVRLTRDEFYNYILSDWEVTDIYIDGKHLRSKAGDTHYTLDDYFKNVDQLERAGCCVFWKEIKYIPNEDGDGVQLHMITEIKMWRI